MSNLVTMRFSFHHLISTMAMHSRNRLVINNFIYLWLIFLITALFLFLLFSQGKSWAADTRPEIRQADDSLSKRMKAIIAVHVERIKELARSSVLIESVRGQNQKGMSLEEIRKIDQEWIAGKRGDFVMELQTNPSGTFLYNKLSENRSIYVEAFLCDNQGAVVGEYPKTTDYWQGDEDKFIKCFNNGNGKVYVGPVAFDDSTKTISVQISVPVLDNGKTIGVLIIGLKNVE